MKIPLLFLFVFSFSALAQNPLQMVEGLYEHYKDDKPGIVFDRAGNEQVISSRLMAQVEKDRELTPEGDIGALNYDPICNCQDYSNLVLEEVETFTRDKYHAEAKVRFRPFSESNNSVTQIFMLVNENGRWLIDDIMSKSGSVYQRIEQYNQWMEKENQRVHQENSQ